MKRYHFIAPLAWVLVVAIPLMSLATEPTTPPELIRLPYNHPGLSVDLGVGLWAWPIVCDADGDGDYDLIVSCPDKPSNGIWLFENTTGDTSIDKYPIFKAPRKLSDTVHYVMPSYIDGNLRVLSPGIEYLDFVKSGTQKKLTLPISPKFYSPIGSQPRGPKVRHNQWRYVDYDGDGAVDLVVGIEDWSNYGWDDAWDSNGTWTNGKLHGFVFLFRNEATTQTPRYSQPIQLNGGGAPIDVYGCPSPNFADFDGDGDLDLICGEFLDGFTYFENVGTRTEPVYAAGRYLTTVDGERLTMDLQMIVPIAIDWDKDGDIDLVVGDEDGRVALVENTGKLHTDRTPQFLPPRYFQQQADTLKSGALSTPVAFDWDGDGDLDILSGNTAGYIDFFENLSGPGVELPKWAAPIRLQSGDATFRVIAGPNGSIQGPAEAKWGYTCLSVADWDADGLPDIVFNDIWGKVRWLKNVGTRTQPKLADPQSIEVHWDDNPPKPSWTWWTPLPHELVTQWRTTPIAFDWTGDGIADLVMLDHDGFLVLFERTSVDGQLRLLPPRRVFWGDNFSTTDNRHIIKDPASGPMQLNVGTAGASGRRKIWLDDWDGDGAIDIFANSTSANILRQVKSFDGKWFFRDQGPLVKQSIQGHSTSPTTVDFNNDGIPDFLAGAEDGRFYYFRNPRSNRD